MLGVLIEAANPQASYPADPAASVLGRTRARVAMPG